MNGTASTANNTERAAASRISPAMVALLLSIVICTASQLLLKHAITGEGSFFVKLFTLPVIGGLAAYATGTALWVVCLRRLDLSFAFPASAMQHVLIVAGAWSLLGETIPPLRIAGVVLIVAGVFIIATGKPATPSEA